MPQMKPLNWLYLYLTFMMMITLMNLINYFYLTFNKNFNILNPSNNKLNWKW